MAFPEDLLEQAHYLAQREPRRPKQASLRRAVSTAYYAIFHLLIGETVLNWKRPSERDTLARMFEHKKMRDACIQKRDELNAYFNSNPRAGSSMTAARHLLIVAETFVKRQQDRHSADYDNSVRWTRTEVIARIESVRGAFQSWGAIRETEMAHDFLVRLLLRER